MTASATTKQQSSKVRLRNILEVIYDELNSKQTDSWKICINSCLPSVDTALLWSATSTKLLHISATFAFSTIGLLAYLANSASLSPSSIAPFAINLAFEEHVENVANKWGCCCLEKKETISDYLKIKHDMLKPTR